MTCVPGKTIFTQYCKRNKFEYLYFKTEKTRPNIYQIMQGFLTWIQPKFKKPGQIPVTDRSTPMTHIWRRIVQTTLFLKIKSILILQI